MMNKEESIRLNVDSLSEKQGWGGYICEESIRLNMDNLTEKQG